MRERENDECGIAHRGKKSRDSRLLRKSSSIISMSAVNYPQNANANQCAPAMVALRAFAFLRGHAYVIATNARGQ
jgi:hypothetical protein